MYLPIWRAWKESRQKLNLMCFYRTKMTASDSELVTNDKRTMYQLGNEGKDDNRFLEPRVLACCRQLLTDRNDGEQTLNKNNV